jgi:hypothetical protein
MNDEYQLVPLFGPPDHFGGCPKCGRTGVYVDIGSDHYNVCEEHRVYWYVGSNLFSSWREGTEEEWEENQRTLADWTNVSPIHTRLEMHFLRLARALDWCRRVWRGLLRLANFWSSKPEGKPADDIPL